MSNVRIVIGSLIWSAAWALYAVRVVMGIGPMHDHQGNQAPTLHYLMAAVVATVMVAAWITIRGRMERRDRLVDQAVPDALPIGRRESVDQRLSPPKRNQS